MCYYIKYCKERIKMKLRFEEKLETFVRVLSDWRTNKKTRIKTSYCVLQNPVLSEVKKSKNWKLFDAPYTIFSQNTYIWFKGEFDIKDINNKDDRIYLNIDTCINPLLDCTERPQGILYINDELIEGIDVNHVDVLLNKNGRYTFYLYFYTHSFANALPLHFAIKHCDKRIEDAYYDFLTILEDVSIMRLDDPRYEQSLKIVNDALNLIDMRNRDELFFASLNKSRQYLSVNYFENKKLCGKDNCIINCVGNAHIDMAWLWDLEQTHQKGLRTFSTVLKLMDEYPDYKFMHTSPQLFKFVKEDNPQLFARIKKRVQEGRFEIDGAMWVEPDCNLTSGESLVRQILYGKDYLKKEFNIDSKTLILPDVFGYCYQLPQILTKSGVTRFITAKMGWSDTNRFPYDTFLWQGLDGTKIFTYLISTCAANPRLNIKDTNYTTYSCNMTATHLLGTYNRYELKKLNNNLITFYGYGDGGGGPTREMLEKEKRYHYGLPLLGKTKLTTLKEALETAENSFNKNCKKYHQTPIWKDELYLEYHRGTYTSVPRIKRYNRDLEFSFLNTELVASLDAINNRSFYPAKKIHPNYETFLLHQFHDILPGSAIKKVYDDADKYLSKIASDNQSLINHHLANLLKDIKSEYIVFNPNAFVMSAPIIINKQCYVIKDIPSVGYKSIKLKHQDNKIVIEAHHLSNEYFDIKFNANGEITSLFDKINHKEIVKPNNAINRFVIYEDMPYKYDNWEMSPYYKQKHYPLTGKTTFTTIKEGDRQGFKITHHYYQSEIVQYIYVYNGLNRIDFINQINWKEKRQLLKIHFPLNIKCEQARFDMQFGSIGRSYKPKNQYDEAKFEVCAHKWVDVSNGKYGVAILNDSKYGYGLGDGDISLTVLKSGSYPFDEATDICPEFKFAIFPHTNDYRNEEVNKAAYAFNRTPLIYHNAKMTYQPVSKSFVDVDATGVIVETFKKAHNEDAYIIRGYESINHKTLVKLKIDVPFKKAYLADLLENNIKVLPHKNNVITLSVKPFEIFTVKIEL